MTSTAAAATHTRRMCFAAPSLRTLQQCSVLPCKCRSQLTRSQRNYLKHEDAVAHNTEINELIMAARDRIDHCLEHLTAIPDEQLYEPRPVGRDELPSTVIGLLFHAAEHTTMHVGQIRTTLKVIRGTP